LYFIN